MKAAKKFLKKLNALPGLPLRPRSSSKPRPSKPVRAAEPIGGTRSPSTPGVATAYKSALAKQRMGPSPSPSKAPTSAQNLRSGKDLFNTQAKMANPTSPRRVNTGGSIRKSTKGK